GPQADGCDLPNDQKIIQHPHRSEFLLNGRFGSGKVLNPRSHMKRPHGREVQAMSGAPVKKLPASPRVGSPSVPVSDRGGEKVNVGFGDFGAGSSNQLRDPRARRSARNNRDFSLGKRFHTGSLLYWSFHTLGDVTAFKKRANQGRAFRHSF